MASCPFFNANANAVSNGHSSDENAITYSSYLQLDKLLNSQHLMSSEVKGRSPAHDEMLFIITHQTFELWFKQLIYEMDSIRASLNRNYVKEKNMLVILSRVTRMKEILNLITQQFGILQTMTAKSFSDFRPHLGTSSGFQSCQFRLIEIGLGVNDEARIRHNKKHFSESLNTLEQKLVTKAQEEKSLLKLVNDWLERTPGLDNSSGFNFFERLKKNMAQKSDSEASGIDVNSQDLICPHTHEEKYKKGDRRLSFKAMQGALMIYTYSEQPRFQVPFQFLQGLVEVDIAFNKIRYNHASMVQRMLGFQPGTGGSSGYHYLRSTCSDRYRVFMDLIRLSSVNLPDEVVPKLHEDFIKNTLSFHDADNF